MTVSVYRFCLCAALAFCAIIGVIFSWHWPLVGDASLMHYVVFLAQHGLTPYRTIVDVNLPGSYFSEAAAIYLFGHGAIAWRLYDISLALVLLTAAVFITWHKSLFAGLF